MEKLDKNLKAKVGEFIGGNLDFYTFRTLLDITSGEHDSEGQQRLNRLIQVISMRCQPIIINIEEEKETSPADFENVTGEVTVYTLKFAFEHEGAWDTTPTLQDELVGVCGFDLENTTLYYHRTL